MTDAPLVRFDRVEKRYGATRAVRGVSLEVRRGEVFGLLGPNGAGKTSLMRMATDIVRPDAGTVELFGEPLRRASLDRVGYLPEERGLYRNHRVAEILAYLGGLKGLTRKHARRRSEELLDRLRLREALDRRIESLSKGQGQKVQIVAALLADPDLAILDEPFTGLDPVNVQLVYEVLGDRTRAGKTTILSTHQMGTVEALCDRVGLIHNGVLVLYGATEEVRRAHSAAEIRLRARGELPALPTGVTAHREEAGTVLLTLPPGLEPHALLTALVRAGAAVEHFERILTPMERIFVRVVEEASA